MKALTKITMKKIGLDSVLLTKVIEHFDDETPVCRIGGQVRKAETKVSKLNDEPYTEFTGDFEAVNLITKEVIRSKKLILPAVAELPLADHVANTPDGEVATTFAFDVTIEPTHATNATMSKYAWGVNILTEVERMDFLARLSEMLPPPQFIDEDVSKLLGVVSGKQGPALEKPSNAEIENTKQPRKKFAQKK